MPNWDTYDPITTPDDSDTFLTHHVSETIVGKKMRKITLANVKATLKAYFDTLYPPYPTQQSYVSTQFDKTSDTALANITGLTANALAAGVYKFTAILFTNCDASGGGKVAISGTCTATTINYRVRLHVAAGNYTGLTAATALDTSLGATSALIYIAVEGVIVVNAAGTLTVQFAQNASSATASSVLVGSTFEVEKIG